VSEWIFTRFAQQFTQAADVGESIKQFTNEDSNHVFELGLTDTLSAVLLFLLCGTGKPQLRESPFELCIVRQR
jgi:hypothetical protein